MIVNPEIFKARLRELLAENPKSLTQIATELGVSKQTVSGWNTGRSTPTNPTIVTIANYFNVNVAWMFGYDVPKHLSNTLPFPRPSHTWATPLVDAYADAKRPTREAACNVLQIPYVEVEAEPKPEVLPTACFPSAAGIPVWVGSDDMIDREYPPGVVPKGTSFAIPISGDSMEPTIPNGSYVFIKQQPEVRNNEIGVFMLYDEAVCKRYYRDKNGVKLLSDNPKYDPISIAKDAEGFGLIGKVLGHYLPD